jgi:uncharacterized protein (TIGR02444 family)
MSSVETASTPQTNPFWTFSLGYYRAAGVSEACLELQDNCGVDVNVVLFLLWQATQKRQFAAVQVKALTEKVGPWQIDVIGPIRGLRRMLKSDAPLLDKGSAELFRTKIKAIELEAERLQQEAMHAMAAGIVSEAAATTEAAARASIAAYESVTGHPFTPAAVDTLIAALK